MKRVVITKTYKRGKPRGYDGIKIDENIRHFRRMVQIYGCGGTRFDKRKSTFSMILDYEKKLRKQLSRIQKKDRIRQEKYIETFFHPKYKELVKWLLKDEK